MSNMKNMMNEDILKSLAMFNSKRGPPNNRNLALNKPKEKPKEKPKKVKEESEDNSSESKSKKSNSDSEEKSFEEEKNKEKDEDKSEEKDKSDSEDSEDSEKKKPKPKPKVETAKKNIKKLQSIVTRPIKAPFFNKNNDDKSEHSEHSEDKEIDRKRFTSFHNPNGLLKRQKTFNLIKKNNQIAPQKAINKFVASPKSNVSYHVDYPVKDPKRRRDASINRKEIEENVKWYKNYLLTGGDEEEEEEDDSNSGSSQKSGSGSGSDKSENEEEESKSDEESEESEDSNDSFSSNSSNDTLKLEDIMQKKVTDPSYDEDEEEEDFPGDEN